ncbi:DUF58 domain-containing protein [Niabella drilacis]|uniref:Uncharacterized conserved protein, DUF58 family, contains vWF domain n=1 Tax=Niabella drilacis (strain DSM 25811 / CCM 8410 / CCUG 62505 / LMG 26954 / E90) TaxID=1285928 RepID=A0A1G6VW37_NIADE|nr:DUF58 domain-containing protein [Niabella drilacis]SDD57025.1 Uncharacterized conserved protein, DUF58 family, contains vWF domain [Niabella drilacis]
MQSFYLNKIVYYIGGAIALLFISSYFYPALYMMAALFLALLSITILADTLLVFLKKTGIIATRTLPDRLSIGDDNRISLHLFNNYAYPVNFSVIDELPAQFQERNWIRKASLAGNQGTDIHYTVKPLTRGEYIFYDIHIFVTAPLRLVTRKFTITAQKTTRVYPSYIQMRRFQLLAISNRLQDAGVKRSPRLGHSMEFEHIKEYVRGDDYRTINWKATGRKGGLMVNNYTDERSQQVYCIINKGRVMKMPFEGMTLLDYAINASLVLSNISLVKQDKAGLITFAENQDSFITADKRPGQMSRILETLYKQETRFLEADYEKLYTMVRNKINSRSLLVLFTNFESMESLQRELPALKKMAHYHLLLVVLFENTAITELTGSSATNLEEVYVKTIAEKFAFEKRQMIRELQQNGILGILSTPQQLTVNTINKYLELKNRARI